jgi:hypothetical protein
MCTAWQAHRSKFDCALSYGLLSQQHSDEEHVLDKVDRNVQSRPDGKEPSNSLQSFDEACRSRGTEGEKAAKKDHK